MAGLPVIHELSMPVDYAEVYKAMMQLKSDKASGPDCIPAECLMAAGPTIAEPLTTLFHAIWQREELPTDFRDADIVHIYKRKGDICVITTEELPYYLLWQGLCPCTLKQAAQAHN